MSRITILFICVGIFAFAKADQPVVNTSLGLIKGTSAKSLHGRTYYAFQGIPYAVPPIENLRFQEAIPATNWLGTYNATSIPSPCMQRMKPYFANQFMNDFIGSEDCLYLNIYTPKLPTDGGELLDVLIFIHEGVFQFGFGDLGGPNYLLDRNVILVNFNFRLNVFGFLSFEDDVLPGNNGLKDQVLALKWVNKHIDRFGGDPKKVTLIGLSAGSVSVHFHRLSPLSKGLFSKAISNSGCALNPWVLTRNAREKAVAIANEVGCNFQDSASMLSCLQDRPGFQLVQSVNIFKQIGNFPINPIGPVIEMPGVNAFLDNDPRKMIQSNTGSDVPYVFSHTSDEGGAFTGGILLGPKDLDALDENFDKYSPDVFFFRESVDPSELNEISYRIRRHYLGNKTVTEDYADFSRAFGDVYIVDGVQQTALLHAKYQKSPIFSYRFSFITPKGYNRLRDSIQLKRGAFHGDDTTYIFNSVFVAPITQFPDALAMSNTLLDYLMGFIKGDKFSSWQTVQSGLPEYKLLDIVSSNPEENKFTTEPIINFWSSIALIGDTKPT